VQTSSYLCAALIANTSQKVGARVGKRVTGKALTKTVWYPLLKKTGTMLGAKIAKKTVETTITKAAPVLGGAVSGGIAWASFKPMGKRLIDVFERQLNGSLMILMNYCRSLLTSLKVNPPTLP